jgi:hypothetical protein
MIPSHLHIPSIFSLGCAITYFSLCAWCTCAVVFFCAPLQLQELIDQTVIIESKIDDADPPPGSVEFVETVTKGKYVYEVHRASCKDHALAFLKKRTVDKKLYYIEVETPEGTFGRDVEGMYDL